MPDAVSANINTVANGVLVMLVNVAAMKLMVINGDARDDVVIEIGSHGRNAAANAWDSIAPFDNNGNMTPPGNFPAEAIAMEANFAIPTCSASHPSDENGMFGSTLARCVIIVGMPWDVAENGVIWPSIMLWRLPSPQNIVWG